MYRCWGSWAGFYTCWLFIYCITVLLYFYCVIFFRFTTVPALPFLRTIVRREMDCFPTKKNPGCLLIDCLLFFFYQKYFLNKSCGSNQIKYTGITASIEIEFKIEIIRLLFCPTERFLTERFSAWSIYFQFLYVCVNLGTSARQRKWYVIEITLYYLSVMFLYLDVLFDSLLTPESLTSC